MHIVEALLILQVTAQKTTCRKVGQISVMHMTGSKVGQLNGEQAFHFQEFGHNIQQALHRSMGNYSFHLLLV
eukprot:Gb_26105 [translate_table: standard]